MTSPKSTAPHTKYQFYTTREYFDELILRVRATKPGDRVLLMSMAFNPIEPTIATLSRELLRAAARGVHVTLAVDAHSFLVSPKGRPGPLLPRKSLPKHMPAYFHHKFNLLQAISSYPTGHTAIINVPRQSFSLPIAGRSHIKLAIVNDYVFVGGCNLQDEAQSDLMIGWQSEESSEVLHMVMKDIIQSEHVGRALAYVDRGITIDGSTRFFIDSGMRKQSLIFKEAMQLIDSANEWLVFTCQYFPNSVTAQHLLKAVERGVRVEVLYSHPWHQGKIGGLGQHVSILRERTRLPKILFKHAQPRSDPKLHAKLIACDAGMMIGSHNYVRAGVILGTAEIALKTSDAALASEAVKTLHRGLKRQQV